MGKKKKIVFGILGIFLLIAVGITAFIAVNWSKWTPVHIGSKYSLDDIEEGQAVIAVWNSGEYIVVDKHGKWKFINVNLDRRNWYKKYEDCTMLERFDEVLKDAAIPYQSQYRVASKTMLNWAINIEPFELEIESTIYDKEEMIDRPLYECNFYAVTGSGENRELTLIGSGEDVVRTVKDIRIMLIRSKLEHLDKKFNEEYWDTVIEED